MGCVWVVDSVQWHDRGDDVGKDGKIALADDLVVCDASAWAVVARDFFVGAEFLKEVGALYLFEEQVCC
jgi:hypothetical protein